MKTKMFILVLLLFVCACQDLEMSKRIPPNTTVILYDEHENRYAVTYSADDSYKIKPIIDYKNVK